MISDQPDRRVQFSIETSDTHGTFNPNDYTWTFPLSGEYYTRYKCKHCGFKVEGKSEYVKGEVMRCHVCNKEVVFDMTYDTLVCKR